MCYIKNVTVYDIEVYHAITPNQGLGVDQFHTVDLPMAKQGIAFIKQASAWGGAGISMRQTGLTADFPDPSQGCHAVDGRPGHHLQMTNEYGQIDFCARTLDAANRAWLMLTIP